MDRWTDKVAWFQGATIPDGTPFGNGTVPFSEFGPAKTRACGLSAFSGFNPLFDLAARVFENPKGSDAFDQTAFEMGSSANVCTHRVMLKTSC